MGRQRPRWEDDDDDDIREEFDFVDDDDDDDSDDDLEINNVKDSDVDDDDEPDEKSSAGKRAVNGDDGGKPKPRRGRSGGRGRGTSRGRAKEPAAEAAQENDDQEAEAKPKENRSAPGRGPQDRAAEPAASVRNERHADEQGSAADRDEDDREDAVEAELEIDESTLPPDNQDAIRALRDLGARVDINEKGRVWRVFLYEKNKDNSLAQIHGFPLLKEVWLLGAKVSKEMVAKLREVHPNTKIYI